MKKNGFGRLCRMLAVWMTVWVWALPGYAQPADLLLHNDITDSLRRHVAFLTADSLRGRAAGSEGEMRAAEYIHDRLAEAGVMMISPRTGEDFYISLPALGVKTPRGQSDTLHSRNVVGIVPGYDPLLREEYIVIGAHMDHLGVQTLTVNGRPEERIYPGADDNASGVAVLLEAARLISSSRFLFRRSVVFAFFGAEELGMLGSWYFLNRSFGETENIAAMMNVDMAGRSGSGIRVYTLAPNRFFTSLVNRLSARSLSLQATAVPTDYFPSDHRVFYEKQIPSLLFTSGIHRDYHTPRDTPDQLDYTQMEQLTEFVAAAALDLAGRSGRIADAVAEEEAAAAASAERVYTQMDADKKAQFLHGDERQFLNKWVYPYMKYPDSAVAAGEQGTVVVDFIVEKNGKVSHVEIVRGVSEEIDEQVLKVVSASPKWKAAQINGRPVRVKISVPVEFRLGDGTSGRFRLKK